MAASHQFPEFDLAEFVSGRRAGYTPLWWGDPYRRVTPCKSRAMLALLTSDPVTDLRRPLHHIVARRICQDGICDDVNKAIGPWGE